MQDDLGRQRPRGAAPIRAAVAAAGLALGLCACTALLGDDFAVVAAGAGGQGATTAGGGGAGGGAGGLAGTGGTGGTTSGTGGTLPGQDEWHVDATLGNDNAEGVAQAPFRTLKRAFQMAKPSHTIVVHAGTYDQALGESFDYKLPSGVTIRAASEDAQVLITGPGPSSATLWSAAGDSTIEGPFAISSFATVLVASGGSHTWKNLSVSKAGRAVSATGGSIDVTNLTISGVVNGMDLGGTAVVDVHGGELTAIGPNCMGGVAGFHLGGTAKLTLEGYTVKDGFGEAVSLRESSELEATACVFTNMGSDGCGNGETIGVADEARVTLASTEVSAGRGWGVLVYGGPGSTAVVLGGSTVIKNNAASGVDVSAGELVVGKGVLITGNSGAGLQLGSVKATVAGAVVSNNTSDGIYCNGPTVLELRSTELCKNGGYGVYLSGSGNGQLADLGTASTKGGNLIKDNVQSGLGVNLSGSKTVDAVGNTWMPNEQGANASGVYPMGSSIKGTAQGKNVQIFSGSVTVML
jgi:hypothetical protein